MRTNESKSLLNMPDSAMKSENKYNLIKKVFELRILKGKNCVLLNSVQEFNEIESWLLVTLFTCLYNQLSSIYSTFLTY